MALQLRPNCELCDKDLPPSATDAFICSYECTFCADCVSDVLHNVCPNCGGGFAPRPLRPAGEWRPQTGLKFDPPDTTRRHTRLTHDAIRKFSATLETKLPTER
jgi:hypothetical protein